MTDETLIALISHFADYFPAPIASDLTKWAIRLHAVANHN